MSALPLGVNQVKIQRGLTTSSVAIFVPFISQELFQGGEALYYGLNATSGNMILADRKQLKTPNGLILGTPGSGKSFSAKREILNVFLVTKDDIIICDPEAEYFPVVHRLGGQVIKISPTSSQYVNPMDMSLNYSEDDSPLALKSDFILSFCELAAGGRNGLEPVEKTVIDRAVRTVYRPYLADPKPENVPILGDLYEEILRQPEPEAKRIAAALELYVHGSLNVFNHRTNVDINNRLVCFDIKELGKQLKNLGMLVIQDQVWNRVTVNLYRQDGQGMGKNLEHQMDFWYEDGVSRYSTPVGGPDGVLDANSPSASVIFQEDGGVALYSAAMEEAEGVYYPEEDLLWAEAFERPLNRADTAGMSQGTLRLLRNQYYAVYGRKFDDPQLAEYFSGSRREFHLPLRPRGSGFQQRVWQALQQIPYGQTRSYGQIAEAIGAPKAARAVGRDGRLVGYAGGLDRKERLLSLEARTLG